MSTECSGFWEACTWWKVWSERRSVRGEVVMVAAGTKLGPYEIIVPLGAGTRSCSAGAHDVGRISCTGRPRAIN
jgi:hypothetical protein